MVDRTLTSIALLALGTLLASTIYLAAKGIRSIEDYRDYRAMRLVNDPVVLALADGTLPAGATTQEMLAIATPEWSEVYGRCTVYGFEREGSYAYQTIVTVDDRLVAAHVGSCTWGWSFYDDTPSEIRGALASVQHLRKAIQEMPEHAHLLQPTLDESLGILGMPRSPVNESGEPVATYESR